MKEFFFTTISAIDSILNMFTKVLPEFNVFFFMGVFLTIIGAFLLFGYFKVVAPNYVTNMDAVYKSVLGKACPSSLGGSWFFHYMSFSFST